jgi:hypothetical protein
VAMAATCTACPGGRFGDAVGLSSSACSGNCSAGYACPVGSTNGTVAICRAGQYSLAMAAACTACPAGTWYNASVEGLNAAVCSGPCAAGYACPAGSTNATAAICTTGRYSLASATTCTPCPGGTFGEAFGLFSPACSGNCSVGYACPAGSTNGTAAICLAGQYSLVGAAACVPCPGGRFGNAVGLSSSACSGNCSAGYACPVGSTNGTVAICSAGRYSAGAAAACVACSAGRYGSTAGLQTAECSAPCPSGRFGSTAGATTDVCSGDCDAGYTCPSGSTVATASMCPAGTYSLAGAAECTPCAAGTYSGTAARPSPCSSPCTAGHACPAGSAVAIICPAGQYSLASAASCSLCPPGRYGLSPGTVSQACDAPCPVGRYGALGGLSSAECSGECEAGFNCPPGSTLPTGGRPSQPSLLFAHPAVALDYGGQPGLGPGDALVSGDRLGTPPCAVLYAVTWLSPRAHLRVGSRVRCASAGGFSRTVAGPTLRSTRSPG